jgi:hypothetical protein
MLSHANDNAFMLAEWLYLGADAPMSQSGGGVDDDVRRAG